MKTKTMITLYYRIGKGRLRDESTANIPDSPASYKYYLEIIDFSPLKIENIITAPNGKLCPVRIKFDIDNCENLDLAANMILNEFKQMNEGVVLIELRK